MATRARRSERDDAGRAVRILAVVSSLDPLRGGRQPGATNLLLAGQADELATSGVAAPDPPTSEVI
jgi:hypothetical protein